TRVDRTPVRLGEDDSVIFPGMAGLQPLRLLNGPVRPQDRDQFRRHGDGLPPFLLDRPEDQAAALTRRTCRSVAFAVLGTEPRALAVVRRASGLARLAAPVA